MKLSLLIPSVALCMLPVYACGGVSDGGNGVTPEAPAPTTVPTMPATTATAPATSTVPAPPPFAPITYPQAQSSGGTIITAPKVRPIIFKGDALVEQITDFHIKLAASQYWTDIASEYGIGAITTLPPIILDEVPPTALTDDQIQAWLQEKLASGVLGTADSSTMYNIYYPAATVISDGSGSSCRAFGGYHNETAAAGTAVAYGVLPRCNGQGGQSALDSLTEAASHEVFEWVTDPFPFTSSAYQGLNQASKAWEFAFLGELGDLCTALDFGRGFKPKELGYQVQRMWSNKAAAAGHNPCAPASASDLSYFVGVPMVKDSISLQGVSAKGVSVKVGTPKELAIQFHSDNPTDAAWQIDVIDSGEYQGQSYSNGGLGYTLHKVSGKDGDVTTVTINATKADKALIFVVAQRGNETHLWPAVVLAR